MKHYCESCGATDAKPYTMQNDKIAYYCKDCAPFFADLVKCCITCELLDGCRWHPDENPHKFYCKDWSVRYE